MTTPTAPAATPGDRADRARGRPFRLTPATGRGALTGLASAGIGLVLSFGLQAATGWPALPQVVADGVTLLLPGPVFGALIDALQEHGRPLLLLGLAAVVLAAGAVVGAIRGRRLADRAPGVDPHPPRAVRHLAAALGETLALFLLTLPLVAVGQGTLATGATGAAFLGWLLVMAPLEWILAEASSRRVRPSRGLGRTPLPQWSRRSVLRAAGLGAAGVAVGSLAWRAAVATAPGIGASTGGGGAGPTGATAVGPGTAGAGAVDFGDLSGITPTADFYVVDIELFGPPAVDPRRWRLQVGGLRPFALTRDELLALPHVRQVQTLECISNDVGGSLISTGVFEGVRLADLLHRAGVPPHTVEITFSCVDGYTESLPLADALAPTTLVADRLNGRRLTAAHGFPARVLVVDRYGMKNPKWLTAIAPASRAVAGYWEERAWNPAAIVRTMSRIDHPGQNGRVAAGRPVAVRGVAFAGTRGIQRVELSVDGGASWQRTHLQPQLSPYAWRLWTAVWRPRPGTYALAVRAVDGTGTMQTPVSQPSFPNGATGYDGVTVLAA
ncbi:MAG TPA: molybdopterin-dependent oxidoreductase [Candidatus Micrarchaeia archaeon]|nr:molybdopterin-dependent oxidoreductase [Candidatus Micrarchaeia archaeon]